MIDDAPATIAINEVTRKLEIRNYVNSDASKFDAGDPNNAEYNDNNDRDGDVATCTND
jgi:hypothetical protein